MNLMTLLTVWKEPEKEMFEKEIVATEQAVSLHRRIL